MDKKTLQTEILEKPYQPEKWREVLRDYFGAKKFHQKPVPVTLNGGDIAKSAVELGSFYTADERLVGLYEVHVTQRTWLDKNRVGLRDLLKQVIRHEVDGALIVFTKGEKWRFSFVSEIKTIEGKKETEPKRYTYLFGKSESCRTAAERFDKLKGRPVYLNDLFEAFSVEKLNKDFFKSYKEFFEKFSVHLASEGEYRRILLGSSDVLKKGWEDPVAKPLRDFVKMLLGRIVFLQFLQKKGWMGVPSNTADWTGGDTRFLQNLFINTTHKDNFHSKVLKRLFFETLNSKRENQIAPAALGSNIKIPYLNGGLFDKDVSYENDIDFPRDMFKELLDFFESYNFTIDENDPYDNEVGIDPEMLGHIFENLLEENREKGAFYTPKEIVHYMCQESLIQYLRTHLPECIEDESPATIAIENFIRNGETGDRNNKKNFVVQQAKRIEKLLDNIKVCDPAIGSGAFPMGMLQEIFKAKTSLDLTLDHSEVKKQIIQNNLYGVDIENGAVEIARLRFWLALVVDETEPRPLPNLDYKIMQGNSLLESFEGIDLSNVHAVNNFTTIYEPDADLFGRIQTRQLHFTDTKVLRENNLHQLMQAFFNEIDAEKKQEIRLQINKTVHDHIDYNLELQQISLERQTGEASKINNIDVKSSAKKKLEELKKQLKGLKESRNKLHELQNTVNKPYFLWHLFFADVFEKEGFDIVIGNPPYIQLQKIKGEAALLQAAGYHTFTRSGDIYCLFYEQGNKLLKPRGILCYITSNNWMRTKYGELLRKYFIEQTNPIKLLNFEDTKIFETATIETNIFISKKENNQNQLLAVAMKADYKIGDAIERYFRLNNILIDDLDFDEWTILSKNDFQLKLEIEKVGKRLKNYNVQINYGIKTGLIEAFYIDSKTKEEIISTDKLSAEIIKPLLRGRDIKKFTTLKSEDQWIIFTRRGIDINKYPGVKTYLKKYYEQLRPKNKGEKTGRKPGPYKWYEIQDNVAYHKYFEMEKIVWLIITDKPQFAIDYNGYYTNDGTFILTGENLKFVCCILNSKVSDWYFDKIATSSGMGTTMWKKYKIEKLPVPILPDNVILRKFETLADYLIFINDESNLPVNPYTDNRSISSVFEDVLNMMIYELYFREHMHELEIDVLRFVDEKSLPSLGKDNIKNVEIIGGVYKWLQDQDNPIRNRVILSNIRSKNIIRRINSTTH